MASYINGWEPIIIMELYSLQDLTSAISERQVITRIQVVKGQWTVTLRDSDNPDDQLEITASTGAGFKEACIKAFYKWDEAHR